MPEMLRQSPIRFDRTPEQIVEAEGWSIALAFEGQRRGPFLVDLSHLSRWDIQDGDLSALQPFGLEIPGKMSGVVQTPDFLITRMNPTQCQVWRLGDDVAQPPAGPQCTEITDGQAVLALVGENLDAVLETITTLDIFGPGVQAPCLFQGRILDLPCQIVRLEDTGGRQAILIAFSRGYGQSMAEAILEAARPWDLEPGGAKVFSDWLAAAR